MQAEVADGKFVFGHGRRDRDLLVRNRLLEALSVNAQLTEELDGLFEEAIIRQAVTVGSKPSGTCAKKAVVAFVRMAAKLRPFVFSFFFVLFSFSLLS